PNEPKRPEGDDVRNRTGRIASSELSEDLLRTAEVPGHTHPTKHVDGQSDMCPGLWGSTRGLEETSITEMGPGQLWLSLCVLQHSDGVPNLLLPLRGRPTQSDQRLGQCSVSEGGAEPITALLTQEDRFPGDPARLVQLA